MLKMSESLDQWCMERQDRNFAIRHTGFIPGEKVRMFLDLADGDRRSSYELIMGSDVEKEIKDAILKFTEQQEEESDYPDLSA